MPSLAEPVTTEIYNIELDKIIPASNNKRQLKTKESDDELAKSIAQNGQLVPGIARPHPEKKNCYELAAGHRRYRALVRLKSPTMRLEVRDMTDEQMLVFMLIENLEREAIHPLDEADGFEELARLGMDAKEIARRFHKTPGQVARRMQLCKLIRPLRDAFKKGSFGVALLERVARLPESRQKEIEQELSQYEDDFANMSQEQLDRFVAAWFNSLDSAPWDLDDATLEPKAGACNGCPKRANQSDSLFDDLKLGEAGGCLDHECYTRKSLAFVHRRTDEVAKKTGIVPVLINDSNMKAVQGGDTDGAKLVQPWDVERCKKTDKGAVPALSLAAGKIGDLSYVRPVSQEGKKAVAGATEGEDAEEKKPKTLGEKKKGLKARRIGFIVKLTAEWLIKRIVNVKDWHDIDDLLHKEQSAQRIKAMVVAFGLPWKKDIADKNCWKYVDEMREENELATSVLLRGLAEIFSHRLRFQGLDDADKCDFELQHIAEVFKVPIAEFEQQAIVEIPIPKSWGITEEQFQ